MELRLLEAVPWPLDFAISLKGDEGMELKREKFDVNVGDGCTVRKIHDFTITEILREINFGNSRSAKCAILTNCN